MSVYRQRISDQQQAIRYLASLLQTKPLRDDEIDMVPCIACSHLHVVLTARATDPGSASPL
jgi:hypothetical protein